MKLRAAVVAIWALQGCASGWLYEEKPGQSEAEAIVLQSFGVPGMRPARMFWHEPEDLTCDVGGRRGWVDGDIGKCITGFYAHESLREGPAWIELAWQPPLTFHELSYAHELGHWYEDAILGRPATRGHDGPAFAADGVVDKANAALAAAGK